MRSILGARSSSRSPPYPQAAGRGALGPFMEEGRERWIPPVSEARLLTKLWHVLYIVRSCELGWTDQPSLQVGNLRSSKGSSKLGLELGLGLAFWPSCGFGGIRLRIYWEPDPNPAGRVSSGPVKSFPHPDPLGKTHCLPTSPCCSCASPWGCSGAWLLTPTSWIPFLCRGHKGTAECWGWGWIVTYVDSSKGARVACLCLGRGQR